MPRLLLFSLLFLVVLSTGRSQTTARGVVDISPGSLDQTPLFTIPLQQIEPFLAYSIEWKGAPGAQLQIRFYESATGITTDWQTLQQDTHSERKAPDYLSTLGFAPAASTHFNIRVVGSGGGDSGIQSIRCHFFSPGKSQKAEPAQGNAGRAICPCPLPDYLDRLGWCPSGNCPPDPTPQPTEVTHLIVHHSAGSNSSSDWAAVVRSIWDYHVNSNGWDDIGYNWLIDPNGVLYEGRGNDLQGAHFCGTNVGTMGICMMGTYSTVAPSGPSFDKLKELLAWKSCDRNIDPEDFSFHPNSGLNLFNISGHRDGCSTECPGDSIYARLPQLRSLVKDYITNTCDPSSVSAEEKSFRINVYPNPARDVLNINLPPDIPPGLTLRLFDPSGRLRWQSTGQYQGGEQISLSVKGYPKGWYALLTGYAGANRKILIQ